MLATIGEIALEPSAPHGAGRGLQLRRWLDWPQLTNFALFVSKRFDSAPLGVQQ